MDKSLIKIPAYLFAILFGTQMLISCGGASTEEPQEKPAPLDIGGQIQSENEPSAEPLGGTKGNGSESGFFIASHQPASNATNRSLVSEVSIVFNKALVPATVIAQNFGFKTGVGDVSFDLEYKEGQSEVLLIPNTPLKPNTRYDVTVSDALMSYEGEELAIQGWQFITAGNIGITTQDTIDLCMTDSDLAMLDSVNLARSLRRDCGSDSYPAVPQLSWDCLLKTAALRHSNDMAGVNFVGHDGSDSSTVKERINDTGYSWTYIAENVAAGYNTLNSVMVDWLDSPGHCKNIMSASSTEMGSALVVAAPGTTDYGTYWTQNFARSGKISF